jgi:hypothetical protein
MPAKLDRNEKRVCYLGEYIFMISIAPKYPKCYLFTLRSPFNFSSLWKMFEVDSETHQQMLDLINDDNLFEFMKKIDKPRCD